MFQYRQVLVRLRAGDSERDLARSGLMGREKLARVRVIAAQQGWLDPSSELPDEAAIAAAMTSPRMASSSVSSAEPWRALVAQWLDAGVQGMAIHAALRRLHGYSGSYSSVYRLMVSIHQSTAGFSMCSLMPSGVRGQGLTRVRMERFHAYRGRQRGRATCSLFSAELPATIRRIP